jgi:hypothetical protein
MIAEKVGRSEVTVSREELKEIGVRSYLITTYPSIARAAFTIAIDQELNGELQHNSKEIAVFPPFAGG